MWAVVGCSSLPQRRLTLKDMRVFEVPQLFCFSFCHACWNTLTCWNLQSVLWLTNQTQIWELQFPSPHFDSTGKCNLKSKLNFKIPSCCTWRRKEVKRMRKKADSFSSWEIIISHYIWTLDLYCCSCVPCWKLEINKEMKSGLPSKI